MNEEQQKLLEDRISDALLEPLTDAQLEQLDKLTDNPNMTEDQIENFLRSAGVDIEAISKRVTIDFAKEQGLPLKPDAEDAEVVLHPEQQTVPAPIRPEQPVAPVQPSAPPVPPVPPTPPVQPAQPTPPVPPTQPLPADTNIPSNLTQGN